MTEDGRGQPTVVELAGCRCPDTPHHHDSVELYADPPMALGVAMLSLVGQEERIEFAQARLVGIYLRLGIKAWTFVDEDGRPIPVTEENGNRLLPLDQGGIDVWNAADALYSERVYGPLRARRSSSSAPTPTDGSTSPRSPSGASRRTRSGRSSPPASAAGSTSEVPAP